MQCHPSHKENSRPQEPLSAAGPVGRAHLGRKQAAGRAPYADCLEPMALGDCPQGGLLGSRGFWLPWLPGPWSPSVGSSLWKGGRRLLEYQSEQVKEAADWLVGKLKSESYTSTHKPTCTFWEHVGNERSTASPWACSPGHRIWAPLP